MIALTEDRKMLGYETLCLYPDIIHFVTTRTGGCSKGSYASFNCSPFSGDNMEHVKQNQELLLEALSQRPRELVIPFQVHDVKSLVVDDAFLSVSSAEKRNLLNGVDALITREPGYCLCVSTADCVPVLLYDKVQKAVAAIHAGWRGTVGEIVSLTLERMKLLFGTEGADVIACIGPSISLESFEVGEEVYEAFRQQGYDMAQISCRNTATGKYLIDLWEANCQQLLAFGVPNVQIETAGICTFATHEEFFSARRLGIQSGRILSGIMIEE